MVARKISRADPKGLKGGGMPPLKEVFVHARKGMRHVTSKVPVEKEMKNYGGLYCVNKVKCFQPVRSKNFVRKVSKGTRNPYRK